MVQARAAGARGRGVGRGRGGGAQRNAAPRARGPSPGPAPPPSDNCLPLSAFLPLLLKRPAPLPPSIIPPQIVKKKVAVGDDARGRFSQQAKEYVRTVDRVKKPALKT